MPRYGPYLVHLVRMCVSEFLALKHLGMNNNRFIIYFIVASPNTFYITTIIAKCMELIWFESSLKYPNGCRLLF